MKVRRNIFKRFSAATGIFLLCFISNCDSQNITNYVFSAVSGTFTQIQGTGGSVSPALSGGTLDDGYFNSIAIGFPFTYEGISYTTISASTNGWFTFGNILSSAVWINNLSTGTPRPVVAPLWDDLALSANGDFTYYLSGTTPNQILTLEWLDEKWNYSSGSCISFQVKLFESTKRIEFIYRQEAGTLNIPSASIGLSGLTSGNFLSLNGTGTAPAASSVTETTTLSTKPATGQTYRFDPYTIRPSITSVSPLFGLLNSTVTISGSGFDPLASANIVRFGATQATVLTASSTSLTVSVPAGATYEPLTVTTFASFLTDYAPKPFDVTYTCGGVINSSSYGPIVDFALGATCRLAGIGDIDGDGKPDVAVTDDLNGSKSISIYRNTSTYGTINTSSLAAKVDFAACFQPWNVVFGDVDGDGKADMLVSCYSSFGDSISVYRNTATAGVINSASFATKVNFQTGGYPTVRLADVDGDGKPDMVVSCRTSNAVTIFRNTSTVGTINAASFATGVSFATGTAPNDMVVGDIDGDGKTDVVTVNETANTISVLRNTATMGVINAASFAAKVDFATLNSPYAIKVADMDGDGKLDIINSGSSPDFSVFRNTSTVGSITMATRLDIAVTTYSDEFDVNDIDGDGKPDIAVVNTVGNSTISLFRNSSSVGNCSFAAAVNIATSSDPFDIALEDIDGDSKPEIVAVEMGSHKLSLYQNLISPLTTIAPLSVLNSTSNCDDGTWQTFYDPANPSRVLAAIKDNGNNLGTITVNEYEDGTPGNYNSVRYLARHFKITPTAQPITPVQIRLYFTNAELTALQTVDASITSAASLSVTKYDGPTEDNVYYPNDATSLTWYAQGSITNSTAYGGKYLEFTINGFSEFWIHGQTGVLPIELLSFTATPQDNHVNLNWATATETNNNFFTVEKTKDGQTYETVATVAGAGTSTHTLNYSAVDENPYEGTSYYRLKQTDYNGHFTYSEIIPVNFTSEENLFSVFPNPGYGSVTINCPGDKNEMVELTIYDNTGKLISKSASTIAELEHQQLNLEQGIYSIIVTRGETRFVRQLVML